MQENQFEKTPLKINKSEIPKSSIEEAISILNRNDSTIFPENPLPIKDLGGSAKHIMEHHYDCDDKGKITDHYYGINREKLSNPKITERELLGWTLHEIRHRIQLEKQIPLFSIRDNFELFPHWLQKRIKTLPKELSDKELDAKVTEYIIMFLFDKGTPAEELSKLLLTEPSILLDKIRDYEK